uniref:ISSpo7, transposase n=1 Tax=Magnetospirillum gryphiswaldense TaxID=55518 RepID=A4U3S7_9PROT|nr:ISSpo7, transposase [Magnetospirillum gryphiswaldense MSR-1]
MSGTVHSRFKVQSLPGGGPKKGGAEKPRLSERFTRPVLETKNPPLYSMHWGWRVRFETGAGASRTNMAPAHEMNGRPQGGPGACRQGLYADSFCEKIEDQGARVVIPPRRTRKLPRDYDCIAYKNRWGIEGFFAKLKQWRRIATRYDKLAVNFLGFIKLASIMLWLK